MKKVFQLYSSQTSKIVGSVVTTHEYPDIANPVEEIAEGWHEYNHLEETETNTEDINEFIKWFNKDFVTQIQLVEVIAINE